MIPPFYTLLLLILHLWLNDPWPFKTSAQHPAGVVLSQLHIDTHIHTRLESRDCIYFVEQTFFCKWCRVFNANQPLLWGLQVFLSFQFRLIWVKRFNCCFIIALILHDDRKSPINQNIQTKLPCMQSLNKICLYKQQSYVSSWGKEYSWPLYRSSHTGSVYTGPLLVIPWNSPITS